MIEKNILLVLAVTFLGLGKVEAAADKYVPQVQTNFSSFSTLYYVKHVPKAFIQRFKDFKKKLEEDEKDNFQLKILAASCIDIALNEEFLDRNGKGLKHLKKIIDAIVENDNSKSILPQIIKDEGGNTLLHNARSVRSLEYLLENSDKLGLDVNIKNSASFTPLHVVALSASEFSHDENIEKLDLLLGYGADSTIVTSDGKTVLDILEQEKAKCNKYADRFLKEMYQDMIDLINATKNIGKNTKIGIDDSDL